jgi:hypothetical protein
MSLADVKRYFTTHAKALDFKEHEDGFAWDNIPSSKLHRAFHVEALEFPVLPQNQMALEFQPTPTVRLFFKAFRNVSEGIEMATNAGQVYINRVLAPEYRLHQLSIKNIIVTRFTIEPLGDSNDNAVIARIEFLVKYFT